MTKSLPFALLAAGSLLSATAAFAAPQAAGQASTAKATTATHSRSDKPPASRAGNGGRAALSHFGRSLAPTK